MASSLHNAASDYRDGGDAGFALPSVLFLITILGIVGASLLALGFLRKKEALADAARLKARWAAESGVAWISAELPRGVDAEEDVWRKVFHYRFDDGRTSADVRVSPWGMFYRVESLGTSNGRHHRMNVLLGAPPEGDLSKALIFAHESHQLVLTGSFMVRGGVTTGKAGVTIGTLRDYSTPLHLPIDGQVETPNDVKLPRLHSLPLEHHLSQLRKFMRDSLTDDDERTIIHSPESTKLSPNMLADSLRAIVLDSDAMFEGDYPDRKSDFIIIVQGNLAVQASSRLRGNYCIIVKGQVEIERGATIEGGIIISGKKVLIRQGVDLSAQCFAPVIVAEEGSYLRYPSVLFAMDPSGADTVDLGIDLGSGSLVEGLVGLSTARDGELSSNLLKIRPEATVTGVVYSTTRLECDGKITGSVLTHDLYFYEDPTTYLGWLRRGSIDRVHLPSWYTAPVGIGESSTPLTVLQWD